jgi:D-alanyl-D-alanine carboxypeptidase/D-alanyl-D-alanine-endopeptidase (penicillin-binding protein 4)
MGAPFQENRFAIGTIPAGKNRFIIKGSLPDPALFRAHHCKKYLLKKEIQVLGQAQSNYRDQEVELTVLDTLWSPPLEEIITVTNQKSVNLFAEGLGLQIAANAPNLTVNNNLETFWATRGVDLKGCRFADFSGLAPDNALTVRAMIQVLRSVFYEGNEIRQIFLKSLAVSGESGTMRSLLRYSPAAGHIFAKSGLITGVRNYAGYILAGPDRWYAFTANTHNAICDGQQVRQKLEQLLESMYLSLAKN